MSKKKYLSIMIIVLVCLLLVFLLTINVCYSKEKIRFIGTINIDGLINRDIINNKKYVIITNYDEYTNLVGDNTLFDENFKNHNYILLPIIYDSCGERDFEVNKYNFINGIVNITFDYTSTCGVCVPNHNYYLFEIKKGINVKNVLTEFVSKNNQKCEPDVSYKPIIYFYPEKEMDVDVKLSNPHLLTTTYPKYDNGWNIHLLNNGDILYNNRLYYGLYWEGINHFDFKLDEGFVVKGEDSSKFLEEKLEILGLNDREINEFIIYWLPKLEESKYNYIKFENIDKINEQMDLKINPKPDSIIRVFMEYLPLNEKRDVKEQILHTPKRDGFCVVEWGGTKISK